MKAWTNTDKKAKNTLERSHRTSTSEVQTGWIIRVSISTQPTHHRWDERSQKKTLEKGTKGSQQLPKAHRPTVWRQPAEWHNTASMKHRPSHRIWRSLAPSAHKTHEKGAPPRKKKRGRHLGGSHQAPSYAPEDRSTEKDEHRSSSSWGEDEGSTLSRTAAAEGRKTRAHYIQRTSKMQETRR